jgi:hypothetical protein
MWKSGNPAAPVFQNIRLQQHSGQPAGACDGDLVRSALPIAGVFRKMKITLA